MPNYVPISRLGIEKVRKLATPDRINDMRQLEESLKSSLAGTGHTTTAGLVKELEESNMMPPMWWVAVCETCQIVVNITSGDFHPKCEYCGTELFPFMLKEEPH